LCLGRGTFAETFKNQKLAHIFKDRPIFIRQKTMEVLLAFGLIGQLMAALRN
jgi:hypothetical protein